MANEDSLTREERKWLKKVQADPRGFTGLLVHICEEVLKESENARADRLPKRTIFWEALRVVLVAYKDAPSSWQALGRLGGLKGGPARAAALSPERRSEIAKIASAKRWGTKIEISPVEGR